MKQIFKILIMLTIFSCKAQTPIKSLFQDNLGEITNAYYKDIDNDFDKFVGTWKYQNGNTILLIKIEKRIMRYNSLSKVYNDFLAGEVQYIENGVEKLNTLSNLNNQNLGLYKNAISGWFIKRPCATCPANERQVSLDFTEHDRAYLLRKFDLRHYLENGQDFLRLKFYASGVSIIPIDAPANAPVDSTIPVGIYILTKQ